MSKKVMKVMVKTLACVAALQSVLSLAVACGNRPGAGEDIDESKTQLFIANFNGGFGDQWLKNDVIPRFEADYANYKGAGGKVGVQIIVDNSKDNGTKTLTSLSTSRDEIYFTENVTYYDFVSSGNLLDITDVVTETLTEFGESESIEDKMSEDQVEYFNHGGKYYAIPHYEGLYGITYDVDLFEEELLYFAKNKNNGNAGFLISDTDEKSAGPDGIYNTVDTPSYDDGLPATYEEFYSLCERMEDVGVVPVSWTGQYQKYIMHLATALQTAYEGKEQMMLNYNLGGMATTLVDSINNDGEVSFMEPTEINNTNGYLLNKQAGRYYALSFIDQIINNNWYYSLSFNNAQSHTNAQEDFLYGRFSSKKDTIGMLVEGIWWENEADGIFKDMSVTYTEARAGRHSRRFGFMPLPKAPGQELGKPTFIDYLYSAAFISAKIAPEKVDLAKDFLRYINTDLSLVNFTKITSTPKALQYEISESDAKDLSYYAKNVMRLREMADIVYPMSDNEIINTALSSFMSENRWYTVVNGTTYNVISTTMRDNKIRAKQYFEGLAKYSSKNQWDTAYSKFFNQ